MYLDLDLDIGFRIHPNQGASSHESGPCPHAILDSPHKTGTPSVQTSPLFKRL